MSAAAGIRAPRPNRDPHERWYTADADADQHLAVLSKLYGGPCASLHDPCAGAGAYIDAACRAGIPMATGADLLPGRADVEQHDFLSGIRAPLASWVVTNPPFSLAPQLLDASRDRMVSLLLPVSALEATRARTPILIGRRPVAIVFVGRKRFGGPAGELAGAGGSKLSGAAMAYCVVTWSAYKVHTTYTYWADALLGAPTGAGGAA